MSVEKIVENEFNSKLEELQNERKKNISKIKKIYYLVSLLNLVGAVYSFLDAIKNHDFSSMFFAGVHCTGIIYLIAIYFMVLYRSERDQNIVRSLAEAHAIMTTQQLVIKAQEKQIDELTFENYKLKIDGDEKK